jgi:hypothetical protein
MAKRYKHTYKKEEVKKAYLKLKSHVYYDSSELFQRRQIAIFETGLDENNIFRTVPYIYQKFTDVFHDISQNNFEEKFEVIATAITDYDENSAFFDSFFEKIKLITLPKKFVSEKTKNKIPDNYISNIREHDKYEIERATIFIDLPIELHIISVLWLMYYGYRLDKELGDECLGNRLILNKEKSDIIEGTGLFKPYFSQYQKWRDNAVEAAQLKISKDENIAFINLDIKDYFHSVRIDFKQIEEKLSINKNDNLHKIFKRIHVEYTEKLVSRNIPHQNIANEISNKVILPIGLSSSYVLGNWYLFDFDNRIKEKIRPIYYSRYVDDILMVIPKPNISFNEKDPCSQIKFDFSKYKKEEILLNESISFEFDNLNIIEKFLLITFYPVIKIVDYPEWLKVTPKEKEDSKVILKLTCIPDCYIQSDKTLLYFFDSRESTTVIDKLKQELDERSSEFRDFPDELETDDSFDSQAYHLIFDGTEGKIRTLKDYKENRYGLSVFLANRIFSALRRVKNVDKKESAKILKLFKGLNTLEYYKLWEKIFTYFLVNGDKEGFISFYKHTFEQIKKISLPNNSENKGVTERELQSYTLRYFDIAIELVFSLNPLFFRKGTKEQKEFEVLQNTIRQEYEWIFGEAQVQPDSFYITRFRRSNLVRHHYVTHPLLNYSRAAKSDKLNLVDRKLPNNDTLNIKLLEWHEHALKNSPRRVKFWECCIAVATKRILNMSLSEPDSFKDERYFYTNILGNSIKKVEDQDEQIEHIPFYLDEAFELYDKINEPHSPVSILSFDERKKLFFDLKKVDFADSFSNISINEIGVSTKNKFENKPKIAFANTKLNYEYFIASLRGEPVLDSERFQTFARLLNESRIADADLFLLPECSVPYELISSFAKYSEKNQMSIIAGLEHWKVKSISLNFIVTILPIEVNGVNDSIVVYRLKNHYSHHEEMDVRGNDNIVPKPLKYRYDLFNWKGLYFSPYYCVELADIIHRSIFKSKVDLIISSEWNQDTNYFSSIVESLSRDLHCYVAQVNNSEYGDSRLTQPTKTEKKDLIRLKGGLNNTILVGEIDINSLREFQRKNYELTKDDKTFKPVPPDLNKASVIKRIKNKKHYD